MQLHFPIIPLSELELSISLLYLLDIGKINTTLEETAQVIALLQEGLSQYVASQLFPDFTDVTKRLAPLHGDHDQEEGVPSLDRR